MRIEKHRMGREANKLSLDCLSLRVYAYLCRDPNILVCYFRGKLCLETELIKCGLLRFPREPYMQRERRGLDTTL